MWQECLHCNGWHQKIISHQKFCSKYCESNFNDIRRKLEKMLQNPYDENLGGISLIVKIVHTNYYDKLSYTKHLLTSDFQMLIDYGYLIQSDIDVDKYKLSQKFYENFNTLGIDKFTPIG